MEDLSEIKLDEGFLSEIINAITSGIFVTDLENNILMINPAGARMVGKSPGDCFDRKCYDIFDTPMCRSEQCTCKLSTSNNTVNHGETMLRVDGREIPIEFTSRPLRNHKGDIIGCVENFIDISERLEKDRIIMEQKEGLLKKREEDIRHLQDEILELSTPVIEVWDGIVALPLVGTLDSHRAHIAMQRLLESIEYTRSSFVIIDITGVPTVDSEVASHVLQTAGAVRLMGCETILTGVGPHIARVISEGDVDLDNIIVRARMTDGLHYAIGKLAERKESMNRVASLIEIGSSQAEYKK
ncbi:MAG: PAS domain S-box protein [Thermodesulfobacteriota bacterium]|nr:PAS domain S-box protein [Thermodesulfobacteriota bacterium]